MADEEEMNISAVCIRHEEFILNELKPRLENLLKVHHEIQEEIQEYEKCQNIITVMKGKEKYESYVDIGEGNYVQSVLDSCDTIYIHVGMGFHVEVPLEQGMEICQERICLLQKKVLNLDTTIGMLGQDIQEVRLLDRTSRLPAHHTAVVNPICQSPERVGAELIRSTSFFCKFLKLIAMKVFGLVSIADLPPIDLDFH
jgi:prefoldin alpha subunit